MAEFRIRPIKNRGMGKGQIERRKNWKKNEFINEDMSEDQVFSVRGVADHASNFQWNINR